jgi:hypothetical protein
MYGTDDRTFVLRRLHSYNHLEYCHVNGRGRFWIVHPIRDASILKWIDAWNHYAKNPLGYRNWQIVEVAQAKDDDVKAGRHMANLKSAGNYVRN